VVDDLPPSNKIGSGVGITHGAAYGEVATTPEDVATCLTFGKPYILVRRETTPEDFPLMLGAAGIITAEGGETCHAAVVARHQGIPAVIGVGEEVYDRLTNPVGRLFPVTLDAYSGTIWDNQLPLTAPQYGKEVGLLMKWWKKAQGQPVIKPELCTQRFATNTALNNFYLAEAMLAECTDDALVVKIRTVHQQLTTETSAVFSTYLVLAVASEVTYACKERNTIDEIDPKLRLPFEVAGAFDQLRRDFTLKHRDSWCGLSAPTIAHELASVEPAQVRDFFRICRRVFVEGAWEGSIGGMRWAAIAEVGELYWNSDIAAETFVDRVFDLRHNTATVLNKHPMVYGDDTGFYLTRQLDAKRQPLSVVRKWKALLALHKPVSQELLDLYLEGQQKGVWKE
jgi:phosphohistidine swiveling domain-containing protein